MSTSDSEREEKAIISTKYFVGIIGVFFIANLLCGGLAKYNYPESFFELMKVLLAFDVLLLVMIKMLIKYVRK